MKSFVLLPLAMLALVALWASLRGDTFGGRKLRLSIRYNHKQTTYGDPATLVQKKSNWVLPQSDGIQPDGTLFQRRFNPASPCAFLDHYDQVKRIHFHFENCNEGHLGNRLGEYYGRYLVANGWQVPFTMTCGLVDDSSYRQKLSVKATQAKVSVLKILSKNNTDPGPIPTDLSGKTYNAREVCKMCNPPSWPCKRGMDMMADIMKNDMRFLAYTDSQLAIQNGIRRENDDAVVHLRLGDALNGQRGRDEGIGLFPHRAYSQLIQKAQLQKGPIRSIGIVTAPFGGKSMRSFDVRHAMRSKLVATDLQQHLQAVFPNAIVTIRNDPSESAATAMARLVTARKVAICGSSTFCTEAVLATKGNGFVFETQKHNPWATHVAKRYTNILSYTAPRLSNNYVAQLSDEEMLMWLREQDPNVGRIVVAGPPLIRPAAGSSSQQG